MQEYSRHAGVMTGLFESWSVTVQGEEMPSLVTAAEQKG